MALTTSKSKSASSSFVHFDVTFSSSYLEPSEILLEKELQEVFKKSSCG